MYLYYCYINSYGYGRKRKTDGRIPDGHRFRISSGIKVPSR